MKGGFSGASFTSGESAMNCFPECTFLCHWQVMHLPKTHCTANLPFTIQTVSLKDNKTDSWLIWPKFSWHCLTMRSVTWSLYGRIKGCFLSSPKGALTSQSLTLNRPSLSCGFSWRIDTSAFFTIFFGYLFSSQHFVAESTSMTSGKATYWMCLNISLSATWSCQAVTVKWPRFINCISLDLTEEPLAIDAFFLNRTFKVSKNCNAWQNCSILDVKLFHCSCIYSRHLRTICNSVMLLQVFFPLGAVDNYLLFC